MSDEQEWRDFFCKGIETISGQRYEIERLDAENAKLKELIENDGKEIGSYREGTGLRGEWRELTDENARLDAENSILRNNLVQAYVDNGCDLDEALEIAGLDVCPDGVDYCADDGRCESENDCSDIENYDDDLNTCPRCGGPADNGHDRCLPPSPYLCTKCAPNDHNDFLKQPKADKQRFKASS